MIIASQLHSEAGTGCFFFFPLAAHIVCEALRAGMWETVVIKVFCNSIKDPSPTVPPRALTAILHLSPARGDQSVYMRELWPQLPGSRPLLFN